MHPPGAMAAEGDPDITMTAATMPIGGQVKDSGLQPSPMETFVHALAHDGEQTAQVGCLSLFCHHDVSQAPSR